MQTARIQQALPGDVNGTQGNSAGLLLVTQEPWSELGEGPEFRRRKRRRLPLLGAVTAVATFALGRSFLSRSEQRLSDYAFCSVGFWLLFGHDFSSR